MSGFLSIAQPLAFFFSPQVSWLNMELDILARLEEGAPCVCIHSLSARVKDTHIHTVTTPFYMGAGDLTQVLQAYPAGILPMELAPQYLTLISTHSDSTFLFWSQKLHLHANECRALRESHTAHGRDAGSSQSFFLYFFFLFCRNFVSTGA